MPLTTPRRSARSGPESHHRSGRARVSSGVALALALLAVVPAHAQHPQATGPAVDLLMAAGVGRRAAGRDFLHSPVVALAVRPTTARLLLLEAEIGYWHQRRHEYRDETGAENWSEFQLFNVAATVLVAPRIGPVRPHAGLGVGAFMRRHDTRHGDESSMEPGVHVQAGLEVDLTDRIGAFGIGRVREVWTHNQSMLLLGVRIIVPR